MDKTNIKLLVQEKYGEIARQSKLQNETSCCGSTSCCGDGTYTIFSDDYSKLNGYNPDADLGLGCGLPTEYAHIKKGDTVLDLGSGAGNDCFVARAVAGETGKVIGLDMTEAMIEKARKNAEKLGFSNVEFRLGDIEDMPVESNSINVVISNCVLNLVPDKEKAFAEIYRVLKPGGHLSVSDVVIRGELPQHLREAAELYAGCVAGAIAIDDYLAIMNQAGLKNITIQKEKAVQVPGEILLEYLSSTELEHLKNSGVGIFSITVYAENY